MPSTSNPEKVIIDAVIDRLKQIVSNTLLGYSATGHEDDLELPAIFVQLESINEEQRQGAKAKYRIDLNVSLAERTNTQTTYKLIELSKSVRSTLGSSERICPEARKVNFSETQFDIAPSNSQLSFADISLQIEAVF